MALLIMYFLWRPSLIKVSTRISSWRLTVECALTRRPTPQCCASTITLRCQPTCRRMSSVAGLTLTTAPSRCSSRTPWAAFRWMLSPIEVKWDSNDIKLVSSYEGWVRLSSDSFSSLIPPSLISSLYISLFEKGVTLCPDINR